MPQVVLMMNVILYRTTFMLSIFTRLQILVKYCSNNKFSCNIKGFRKDVHAAYKYLDELFNVSLLAIKIHLNFS